MAADKEKISMIVDRLKGPGGLPISAQRASKLKIWLNTLNRKGYLSPEKYRDVSAAKAALVASFPNPGTRSLFLHNIVQYISLLQDHEFANDFSGLSRRELVEFLRQLATEANRENAALKANRVRVPNAPS